MVADSQKYVLLIGGCCVAASLLWWWRRRTTGHLPQKSEALIPILPDQCLTVHPVETKEAATKANDLDVFFGSQTGTAESFARCICDNARQKGLSATLHDLEDWDPTSLRKMQRAVFVVATYGEGDPTDNAISFHEWLMNERSEEGDLSPLEAAVFGLGNRQYVHFNSMAKKTQRFLTRRGVRLLCETGFGDDDGDIEADFDAWQTLFWKACDTSEGKPGEVNLGRMLSDLEDLPAVRLCGSAAEAVALQGAVPSEKQAGCDLPSRFFFACSTAEIVDARELTVGGGRSTKHVEIRLPATSNFETADNLDVLARNATWAVNWWTARIGLSDAELDTQYIAFIHNAHEQSVLQPFPSPCTVRTALEEYCDLLALPSRRKLRTFVANIREARERDAAMRFLDANEDSPRLHPSRALHMSFVEFVHYYLPTARLKLGDLINVWCRNRPRTYTMCSSRRDGLTQAIVVSLKHNFLCEEMELLSSLTKQNCPPLNTQGIDRGRSFDGLASGYLCREIAIPSSIRLHVKSSTFRLPQDRHVPVIFVAAGTGIGPFRAFLRDMAHEDGPRRHITMFFGCTHPERDFLYKDEIYAALSDERLSCFFPAFSRLSCEKHYVQHEILRQRSHLTPLLLNRQSVVFVCGGAAMGRGVASAIDEVANRAGYVEEVMRRGGRWIEELWT